MLFQPCTPNPTCKVECLVDVGHVCHALHGAAALDVDQVHLGGDGGIEQEAVVATQSGVCNIEMGQAG